MSENNQEEITKTAEVSEAPQEQPHAKHAPREYIAFISYRHTELDKKVAKKVHYMVEHYIIPKELRKDGNKKLGKVFRDEEELPVSSNLTQSIETALDHSKFLIVICTPNLIQSIWCQREIAYFIEKHGRDHVVGILVDGTPDESFPKLLTQHIELDEDGNESIREVEPLAANLTDVNHRYKESRLRKEAVRLYAALLGCPFDSLWQREKRQKMRKLVALMSLAMTIALAFCASIYRKNLEITARNVQIEEQNVQIQSQNVEIKEQYEEIQDKNADLRRSEAQALIRSGELLLEKGDTRGAIQNARMAISTPEGRESVGNEAEYLLYRALGAGLNSNTLRTVGVIDHEDDVKCIALSKDGSKVFTLGGRGYVRCFSTEDCQQIWIGDSLSRDYYYDAAAVKRLQLLEGEGILLCDVEERVTALSLEDGSLVWTHVMGETSSADFVCLSADHKKLAVIDNEGGLLEQNYILRILNTKNGEVEQEISIQELLTEKVEMAAFGSCTGAFSEDGRYLTFTLYEGKYVSNGRKGNVFLADFEEQSVRILASETYENTQDYPFSIGMLCHADSQCVLSLRYRPDLGGAQMDQIFFDGKLGETSLVPLSLPERGMTNAYATTFVPSENNALLASCMSMNLLYRVDNGMLIQSEQTASESVLKRSWINQETFSRSELAADGNHYARFGTSGYAMAPFSEKKHIVFLEITDDYATSEGGYGYVMDENVVQVVLCDDNMRRLYVQKQAKDPDVKAPQWTKDLAGLREDRLSLSQAGDNTLVIIQELDGDTDIARLTFVDVDSDTVKKTVDVDYGKFGTYSSFYAMTSAVFWRDERHFTYVFGGKLYVYDMETGESTLLIKAAADFGMEQHACVMANGEVLQAYLAHKENFEYGDGGGKIMWQIGDGEVKEAIAPDGEEWGKAFGSFYDEYLSVGENGYLLVSAYASGAERRSKYVAIDATTGNQYELADACSDETEGTVILGKKKPLFAAFDPDGVLRVYDIATQKLTKEIKLSEGLEVADASFATDDSLIVTYSRDGRIFVYELASGNEVASFEIGESTTTYSTKELTCYDDPARNRLLITVTDETGVGLDTRTFKKTLTLYDEADTFFAKKNVIYKLNREDSLSEYSNDVILKHVPLTLDELAKKEN